MLPSDRIDLYQVKGWDPMVLGGSILALTVCALFASISGATGRLGQSGDSLARGVGE